jgi:acyl-CoA thioester hydrolase
MRAQHVEYHAPARFDDELEVFVRVKRIGATSIVWQFEAYNVATSEHLATAQQTMVQVDLANRRPVRVPDRVRSAIEQFDREVQSA